jgi:hypothetical protein
MWGTTGGDNYLATQVIHYPSWNTKLGFCFQNSLPMIAFLNQLKLVQNLLFDTLTLNSHQRLFSKRLLPFRFRKILCMHLGFIDWEAKCLSTYVNSDIPRRKSKRSFFISKLSTKMVAFRIVGTRCDHREFSKILKAGLFYILYLIILTSPKSVRLVINATALYSAYLRIQFSDCTS